MSIFMIPAFVSLSLNNLLQRSRKAESLSVKALASMPKAQLAIVSIVSLCHSLLIRSLIFLKMKIFQGVSDIQLAGTCMVMVLSISL